MTAARKALASVPEPEEVEVTPEVADVPEVPVSDEATQARDEALDEPKTLDFHGVEFALPTKLPAALFFDLTEAELSGETATSSYAVHAAYDLLGQDQWHKAKAVCREHNLSADEFGTFVDQIFAVYGMGSAGESSESSDSSESDSA